MTGWSNTTSIATTARAFAMRRVADHVRKFRRDERGSISLLFGLTLLMLLCLVGAAIDFALATAAKARLDAAADAAVLSAVNHAALSMSSSKAQALAESTFKVQSGVSWISATSASVTVNDTNIGRTATLSYSADMPTQLIKLAGFKTMALSNVATASSALPAYIDFYLLLDNTPSMGIAATPTGVSTMQNNADVTRIAQKMGSPNCAFACHDLSGTGDTYSIAKNIGVTMRIDVVRQATQSLMDTASATATVPDQFRMAIYTFGSSCTKTGLNTITTLTSNLSSAKTAANAVDLMTIPYQGYNNDQCTDYDNVLAAMNNTITTPGSGTSAAPQKFLFFVSDGVADAYYPSTCTKRTTGGRCQEPLTTATCTAIKNRGVQIAVLYTTYLALPTNNWYNTWIAPFNVGPYGPSPNSEIANNMKACASPGFYFEVSPTDGISDAMTALFQKAVQTARLTR